MTHINIASYSMSPTDPILPDRCETTTLPGLPERKGVAINTTITNTAYVPTKHVERLEEEYEPISRSLESPPGPYVVRSSPPPSDKPIPAVLPPASVPPPDNVGEEAVYEHISMGSTELYGLV